MTPARTPQIRVVLCDCHDISRVAIADLLSSEYDLELVGEYTSPEAALFDLQTTRPDVVVLNPNAINDRTLTACDSFAGSQAHCLVLSSLGSDAEIAAVEGTGAALLLKSARMLELAPVIRGLAAHAS